MNLSKILGEAREAIFASLRFLSEYFHCLLTLTIHPSRFADQFPTVANKSRFTKASLFLFTTLLVLHVVIGAIGRTLDSSYSVSDVGIGVVLQSDVLWDIRDGIA